MNAPAELSGLRRHAPDAGSAASGQLRPLPAALILHKFSQPAH
jgi:hypothetical protein